MRAAEEFYRKKYPQVKELTLIDKEIINLLEEYEQTEVNKLALGDVSVECEHPYIHVYRKMEYERCMKCGKVLCEG